MSIKNAIALAQSIAAKRLKFGKLGRGTYTQDELQDAVVVLYGEYQKYAESGIDPEEVTKLRRQLAAANARVARLSGKSDKSGSKSPYGPEGLTNVDTHDDESV